jgi:hypothetical protein
MRKLPVLDTWHGMDAQHRRSECCVLHSTQDAERLCSLAPLDASCRSTFMSLMVAPGVSSDAARAPVAAAARSLRFRLVDCLAIFAYTLALVLNIVTASMDAELSYAVSRDPSYFSDGNLPRAFAGRVKGWLAVNALKCLALLAAWLTVRRRLGSRLSWLLAYECNSLVALVHKQKHDCCNSGLRLDALPSGCTALLVMTQVCCFRQHAQEQ